MQCDPFIPVSRAGHKLYDGVRQHGFIRKMHMAGKDAYDRGIFA